VVAAVGGVNHPFRRLQTVVPDVHFAGGVDGRLRAEYLLGGQSLTVAFIAQGHVSSR